MHYSDDDLILYYYSEHQRPDAVEQHLADCRSCAAVYREIAESVALAAASSEPPARGDDYGREIWQRIRRQLPEQDVPWWVVWMRPQQLALAGGVAVLVIAAFVAGRSWPERSTSGGRLTGERGATLTAESGATLPPSRNASADRRSPGEGGSGSPVIDDDAGERVRLAAVGDHLEQTERVLLEIVNASSTVEQPADLTSQQEWAADLIAASRLYRDASAAAGDAAVTLILDELERNLLDIVNGPGSLTPPQLEQLRMRLDAAALLFRVRVLHDELRQRELAAFTPRKTT
jgi:hypothetical protein